MSSTHITTFTNQIVFASVKHDWQCQIFQYYMMCISEERTDPLVRRAAHVCEATECKSLRSNYEGLYATRIELSHHTWTGQLNWLPQLNSICGYTLRHLRDDRHVCWRSNIGSVCHGRSKHVCRSSCIRHVCHIRRHVCRSSCFRSLKEPPH